MIDNITCIKFHDYIYFHKQGNVFWPIWTGDFKPDEGKQKEIPKQNWHKNCILPLMNPSDKELNNMFHKYKKILMMYFPKCYWRPHMWGETFFHKKDKINKKMCKECKLSEEV